MIDLLVYSDHLLQITMPFSVTPTQLTHIASTLLLGGATIYLFRRWRSVGAAQENKGQTTASIVPSAGKGRYAAPRSTASFYVNDRVYFVTGAAMGIGRACAEHLAAHGARGILMFDCNKSGSAAAQQIAMENPGCNCVFVHGDCSVEKDCVQAVQKVSLLPHLL